MEDTANALMRAGEPFGAGLCELPTAAPILRYARAYRRYLETCPLPTYDGGMLYPCGARQTGPAAVVPHHSFTFAWSADALQKKAAASDPDTCKALEALSNTMQRETLAVPNASSSTHRHTVGGNGFTHSIVRYDRVLSEGLEGYRSRVMSRLETASNDRIDFYRGMLDLLEGIRTWHSRLVQTVRQSDPAFPHRHRLLEALQHVPFGPANTCYQAVVAYNVVYYLDGCDNPGRMDQVLMPYCSAPEDEAVAMDAISAFADNVSANAGWSAALGGTGPDGRSAYNPLTEIILRATRGRYRPSIELRVRKDMPDSVWDAAFDALSSGNGQPAFYHEEAYLDGLRAAELGISEADLSLWNGGGCTETMLHGVSNVGSLDCGFNLPLVLSETLDQELYSGTSFESVVRAFETNLRREIRQTLDNLNRYHAARAKNRPQPVRSLLVDDCIDRGRDFNDGGARYSWSVVNVAGIADVADSLEALRVTVFEQAHFAPNEMRTMLATDFEANEPARLQLADCPKFGNGIPTVDNLARRIVAFVYNEIRSFTRPHGGRFIPSHIMFTTYAHAGASVGALPDGRHAGDPLADSAGPVQGRDRNGPTAMLRSVAGLPLHLAVGTPVLNVRLPKASVKDEDGRRRLRALIEGYFGMGGMQLQFTLLDREELEDAMLHPERHEDLIVRIGGFSEYFNSLSAELKQEVIKRTAHAV